MSGYPWLTKIPILKYLFGQETKDRQQNEIVFAITPHIIRSNEITDENLKMVDIGTGNSITYRSIEPISSSDKPAMNQPAQPPAAPAQPPISQALPPAPNGQPPAIPPAARPLR
jgi:type II secretory pathway component GspD/PulD (secretin)